MENKIAEGFEKTMRIAAELERKKAMEEIEKINEKVEHNPNLRRVCAEKEFTPLSEKRKELVEIISNFMVGYVPAEIRCKILIALEETIKNQDKEFIKKLKEELLMNCDLRVIDKLAGEELI